MRLANVSILILMGLLQGGTIFSLATGPYSIATSDRLALSLTEDGRIASLKVGARELVSAPGGGLFLQDLNLDARGAYWAKAIGGPGRDYAPSFQIEEDGYLVVGHSQSFGLGGWDAFIVKLDGQGNILRSVVFGGRGNDIPYTIERTADNGYIITGHADSFGAGGEDVFVAKLRTDWSLEWARAIGGKGKDHGFKAVQTEDRGYLVAATTDSFGAGFNDIMLVKLNEKGDLVFARTIGTPRHDGANSLIKTADGGYALGGQTEGNSWIVKLRRDYGIEWTRSIGGPRGEDMSWDGVRQTSDGGYVYATSTTSFGAGGKDFIAVKLEPDGDFDWATVVGGEGFDAGWTINETADGYIAGGVFKKWAGTDAGDILLIKLDRNGKLLWARTFNGYGVGLDEIEEVKPIDDGYLLVGVVESRERRTDFFVAKVNKDGFIEGCPNFQTPSVTVRYPRLDSLPVSPTVKDISPTIMPVSVEVVFPQPETWTICPSPSQQSSTQTLTTTLPASMATDSVAMGGCEPQNLLSNPGFEAGTTMPNGWTTFPPSASGVVYKWDDTVSMSGARSVSIESTGTGLGNWRQTVPVSPGTVYQFSGYVKVEGLQPSGRCNLQVIFRDAEGKILERVDLPSHSGTIPWIYDFPHEVKVRAPTNSATAEVNLFLQGQGKAWFDDIFFGSAPTGGITGTVTSGSKPLAGAKVIIWGTDYEAITDEQGRYLLSNIPDASPRYLLIASKAGYKDKPQGDVEVVACQTTTVDFDLEPGLNLEEPELRVKFGSMALVQRVPPPQIPPDAVIDPNIYPDSVRPYLQPSEYIDSDHPSVIAIAQEILAGLPLEERANAREVSYAVYRWIIENIEYDVIYENSTFTDVTSGRWQTISGEGWSWGHSFNDWLYKPSEMLAEKRGICIEHSRLAVALLRAVGIPARPVKPYSTQFWVQSPSGEGRWVAMSTVGGRAAYREQGDTRAGYGRLSPSAVQYFPIDEGPVIHSDWYTENKCMWHEVHPWSERYEGTPAGYERAVADLKEFVRTGIAPKGQSVPPGSQSYYEIAYSDFTLHLSNIGDQQTLQARFPIIMASDYVTPTGDMAYWTNHPEWVTRTWIEEEINPPVEGVERWFVIEFDLSLLHGDH